MEKVDAIELEDLPNITFNDARFFLSISLPKWIALWRRVYQDHVIHWETSHGLRINLESLVAAMYPGIADDPAALAVVCHNFIWRLRDEHRRRRDAKKARRLEREAKKNGGNEQ